MVRLPLAEASAKVRTGDPIDDKGDLGSDVWAGVIPLTMQAGTPEPSADLAETVVMPDYIAAFQTGE